MGYLLNCLLRYCTICVAMKSPVNPYIHSSVTALICILIMWHSPHIFGDVYLRLTFTDELVVFNGLRSLDIRLQLAEVSDMCFFDLNIFYYQLGNNRKNTNIFSPLSG